MRRESVLSELRAAKPWDIIVIGGGATGLGTAVDAASRGLRTLLVERDDFAKGTSSRSTKLSHGGVRYLEQFQIPLVFEALHERGAMLRNAPHLAHPLPFIVPIYKALDLPYYGFGLKAYGWLAGRSSLGRTRILSVEETRRRLPTISSSGLKGGVLYLDGQFDDARFAVALLRTVEDLGGCAINYMAATALLHSEGRIAGVFMGDFQSGEEFEVRARAVINAAGVFAEEILQMDGPRAHGLLKISQGTHFVLPQSWLPGGNAVIIPKTEDGRVLFAIPWREHTLVGTTDEPVPMETVEPRASAAERDFLTGQIQKVFGRRLAAEDVLSVWSGLRPLIRQDGQANTSKLSRSHKVFVSPTGLITVTGGKWTTYRRMGEDAIDRALKIAGIPFVPSVTATLKLHGWSQGSAGNGTEWDASYGTDLPALEALGHQSPELNERLDPRLAYKKRDVVWAARQEMAQTVEDVLARRTRTLFLNAQAAIDSAPEAARLLANELGHDAAWADEQVRQFRELARGYLYQPR